MPPKSKVDEMDLIKAKSQNDLKHHEMRMEELRFTRESDKINHDHAMERMRIKSAEIKKAMDRKMANQFPRKQW